MKIFNRGESKQAKAEAAAAPKAEPAAAPAPAPDAQAAPPAPPAPDLTSIIDANVKEMSEKIARLASTIESEHSDRADFEAKLEKMEERMRKLSSLTEMISAQYNPFVGSAPTEQEPMPQPEVGLAAAVTPVAMQAAPAAAAPPPPPPAPLQIALDDPHASLAPALADLAEPAPLPEFAPPQAPAMDLAPEEAAHDEDHGPARLWSVPGGFAANLLVLNWADMLLRAAPTRDALVDIVGYYHNIGWIGDPARDTILAYADGIAFAPEGAEGRDWRANAALHEKSLLYVEKLRALAGGGRRD